MNQGPSLENFGARLREFLQARAALLCPEPWPAPFPAQLVPRGSTEKAGPRSIGTEEPLLEFDTGALELFALQFQCNLAYRRFCENRGATPANMRHWRQIPAVPTAAFKELELTCIPKAQRTAVFHSSGTTQQRPSRHFHHAASLQVYEASLLAGFAEQLAGWAAQPKSPAPPPPALACRWENALALTPGPTQAPHSSLVHMFETLRRKLNFRNFLFTGRVDADGAWRLDASRTVAWLEQASTGDKPLLLLGTAFAYVHLLDHLQEMGLALRLPGGSRVLETGGYKGRSRVLPKSELHALITWFLGVPPPNILCEYGMSELSSQAYDQLTVSQPSDPLLSRAQAQPAACRRFQFPPWARAQIISPETGNEVAEAETGLIRVIDLANVYSVMAVQTEDLAVRRGDGFELIGRPVLAEPRGCSLMAP